LQRKDFGRGRHTQPGQYRRLLLGATVLIAATACGPAPTERATPVILLSIDTLGARHLSLHGYPRETAPQLAALRDEAVWFERCSANAAWTTPSYLSQLTGLYPESLRLEELPAGLEPQRWNLWWLPPERHTLAEALAAAGYRTAAFVDNPMIGPEFGIDQGFELYDTTALEIPQDDPEGGLRTVVPRALEWLDSLAADESFFLFLQALDVHGPYLPAAPYRDVFAGDGLGARAELDVAPWNDVFGMVPFYIGASLGVPPEGRVRGDELARAHDEEIRAVDAGVGELLEGLRARGVLERAVLIVTADHGEAFGEHDLWCQHESLHEEVLHVPLIVRLPDAAHAGRLVADRVQLVDLFPTVLELANARRPDQALHGRSLVPLLEGDALPPAPTFATEGAFSQTCVVDGGWKLIETRPSPVPRQAMFLTSKYALEWIWRRFPDLEGGRPTAAEIAARVSGESEVAALYEELQRDLVGPFHELYRLEDDPLEARDLAAEHPDVVERLRAVLDAERSRARAARREERGAGAGLSAERIEQMMGLGYADAGDLRDE
jgi:arylsulfatase